MDALRSQVTVLTEELSTLKTELINVKSAHATLHQSSVEAHTQHTAQMAEMEQRLESVSKASGGAAKKSLMEPKNITITTFNGAITDARSKFLTWEETVRDKVCLFDENWRKR